MKMPSYLFSFASVLLASMIVMPSLLQAEDNWTRFRGPNGSGVSANSTAPLEWSEDKNLRWSIDLPGPGSSCPIVVGDKVFVTSYTGYGVDTCFWHPSAVGFDAIKYAEKNLFISRFEEALNLSFEIGCPIVGAQLAKSAFTP